MSSDTVSEIIEWGLGSIPPLPRQAPEGLNGSARRGAAGMPRVLRRGWEAPSENPVQT